MKKIILMLVLATAFTTQLNAKAKIPVCFPCEYIDVVADLPETTELVDNFGSPLDVGFKYEQINILWIPIWNYEGEYCLVNKGGDTYYELTSAEKEQLKSDGVEFPDNPIGLWDKLGGKAIILIILGLIAYGSFGKKDEETEKSAA